MNCGFVHGPLEGTQASPCETTAIIVGLHNLDGKDRTLICELPNILQDTQLNVLCVEMIWKQCQ
jgi:hypothetical protein